MRAKELPPEFLYAASRAFDVALAMFEEGLINEDERSLLEENAICNLLYVKLTKDLETADESKKELIKKEIELYEKKEEETRYKVLTHLDEFNRRLQEVLDKPKNEA